MEGWCETLTQIGLIIIIAMVALWAWREMRPLLRDGYGCRRYKAERSKNILTYVDPQNSQNTGPVKTQDECFTMLRKSKFFPASGTTFFGADSTMTSVQDPQECRKIGLRPEFMMIQDGKPIYRCVRFAEPLATVKTY